MALGWGQAFSEYVSRMLFAFSVHPKGISHAPPPPLLCENNAAVRTTCAVVCATFATIEFGVPLLWLCMKIRFLL